MELHPSFWVGLSTIAFFILIAKPVGRAIAKMLDERSAKIEKELNEAKRLRDEAEDLLASYKEQQEVALREAKEIVEHAKQQADAFLTRAREELKHSINKRIQSADKKIAQLEEGMLSDIKKEAVHQAITAVRSLLQQEKEKLGQSSVVSAVGELNQLLQESPVTT